MQTPRHLMIFCSSLQTAGGAERVLSVLSQPFANQYDRVTYLLWKDAPIFYKIDPRVEIVSVEKECGSKGVLRRLWWMRRYVRSQRPDVLLSFSAPFNMLALTALLATPQRIVVAERVDPHVFRWGRCLETLRRWLYGFADGILVQTEHGRAYFKGALRAKTEVIYNPVSMDCATVGAALHTPKQRFVVSAGRLERHKQHDLLIRVFARFRTQYPNFRLVIYGAGVELESLRAYATQCGVGDAVDFPGSVKNLWEQMLPANMFVISSLFEGMSNALIEAMCLGLPCISTKVSGATDVIADGQNGYLIDVGDEEMLYQHMCRLASDAELAQKLGRESSKLFEQLEVTQIATRWIHYINRMMDAGNTAR